MEDEGGCEEHFLQVDFGEGVVEAAEGVAEEGSNDLGEERGGRFHVEDDRRVSVGVERLRADFEYCGDEVEHEVPVGFGLLAPDNVKHALLAVAADHSAGHVCGRVALAIVNEDAAVQELAPVLLFRWVGERGAE